jgi:hypothetical protein
MLLDRARKVSYQEISMSFPFTNREVFMYGFGANRLSYNGSVLVTARSFSLVTDKLIRQAIGEVQDERFT